MECRNKEDTLWKDMLEEWEDQGAIKPCYAFLRDGGKTQGCRYAQDRVREERGVVTRLFDAGARAYICGSSRLGKRIANLIAKIVEERRSKNGKECRRLERSIRMIVGVEVVGQSER